MTLLLALFTAAANPLYQMGAETSSSPRAGATAAESTTVAPGGRFQALTGLEFARSKSPGGGPSASITTFTARSAHVNNQNVQRASATLAQPNADHGVTPPTPLVFAQPDTFVRGIQLCLLPPGTSVGDGIPGSETVYGVRLHGAALNRATGALSSVAEPIGWRNTGPGIAMVDCDALNLWTDVRNCPANRVATGVTLHLEPHALGRRVRGATLVCAAIEPDSGPAVDVQPGAPQAPTRGR